MKNSCSVKKLFVISFLCLLWWHCYCDNRYSTSSQLQKDYEALPESHRGPKHVSISEPKIEKFEQAQSLQDKEYYGEQKILRRNQKTIHQPVNNAPEMQNNPKKIPDIKTPKQAESVIHSQNLENIPVSTLNNIKIKERVLPIDDINIEDRARIGLQEASHTAYTTSQADIEVSTAKQDSDSSSKIHVKNSIPIHSTASDTQKEHTKVPPSFKSEDSPISSSIEEHESKGSGPHSSVNNLPDSQSQIPQKDEKNSLPAPSSVDAVREDTVIHPQHPHSEVMPSFDEWKKMMLAEQEKDGHKIPSPGPPGKKIASQKRRRNYASYECGAKIVASNTEAESTSRILNELVDEYMLNPCKVKIWFVIELCETIQASQIELANFELFSSSPNEFAVYSSDRFPTRDWTPLGIFSAMDQRVLQTFQLKQEGFGKFIKIELLSHYGKEHYCPLSVVRVYGTSMVDEYEEMETGGSQHPVSDDDEDRLDIPVEDKGSLFGSATDAVINMVKKAAQVLGRDQAEEGEKADESSNQQNVSGTQSCKYFDSTSENCTEVNRTDEESTSVSHSAVDLLIPFGSFQHSLFRHLRHCELCPTRPHKGHQSHAQPGCRFLQAALGPVLFGAICEVIKEQELAAFSFKPVLTDVHALEKTLTKTVPKHSTSGSPPPTIISVIIDAAPESPSLPAYSDSIPPSVSSSVENIAVSTPDIPHFEPRAQDSSSPETKLESSIQPTKTLQDSEAVIRWDLSSSLKDESALDISEPIESLTPELIVKPSKTEPQAVTSASEKHSSMTKSSAVPIGSSSIIEEISDNTEPSKAVSVDKILESEPLQDGEMSDLMIDISTLKPEDEIIVTTESSLQESEELMDDLKVDEKTVSEVQKEGPVKIDPNLIGGGIAATPGQKESVFMRMNNRIKALELNMSLSSQYLQELSQRYRRQMEEMQRAFNRTIGTLNDTAKKAAERDLKQQEVIGHLQSQVTNLTHAVDLLLTERTALHRQMIETHVFLMLVEAIVMITILSLCVRRMTITHLDHSSSVRESITLSPRSVTKRRNSADLCTTPISKKVKKRSASEEILTGQNLVIVEPAVPIVVEPPPKVKKKHHRRKNKGIPLPRSASNPSLLQKNTSSSTSLKSENVKEEPCAAGVLFSHTKPKSQTTDSEEKYSHACENCMSESIASCIVMGSHKMSERERRTHSAPLQNLTNGVINNQNAMQAKDHNTVQGKEKFSLKKLLKLQKRDSV